MRALETMQRLATTSRLRATLSLLAMRRRRTDFVCGDCERWRRCGLPPDQNCATRAAQLARDGGRVLRRTSLHDWAAWGY